MDEGPWRARSEGQRCDGARGDDDSCNHRGCSTRHRPRHDDTRNNAGIAHDDTCDNAAIVDDDTRDNVAITDDHARDNATPDAKTRQRPVTPSPGAAPAPSPS